MTVFIRPPSWLPPLRKERSPAKAAIIGLLFGGIGLGLYFKSVVDFLIPVLFTIASTALAAATARTGGSVVGFLGATMVAGRWGYYRARQSNTRLAAIQNLVTLQTQQGVRGTP
jgi:hypothetical protein